MELLEFAIAVAPLYHTYISPGFEVVESVQAFAPVQKVKGPVELISASGLDKICANIEFEVAGLFNAPTILEVITQVITLLATSPDVVYVGLFVPAFTLFFFH